MNKHYAINHSIIFADLFIKSVDQWLFSPQSELSFDEELLMLYVCARHDTDQLLDSENVVIEDLDQFSSDLLKKVMVFKLMTVLGALLMDHDPRDI